MASSPAPWQSAFRKLNMPAEWAPHASCWMAFPYRPDNWRRGAVPAQRAFLAVACAIAAFEPVRMCVPSRFLEAAMALLQSTPGSESGHGVTFVEAESDDAWMRDIGPTFVFAEAAAEAGAGTAAAEDGGARHRQLVGIDWIFNAWGRKYPTWERDGRMAAHVLETAGVPRIDAGWVLEGGAIHTDGEGTLLTTEECLLNPNRNPDLSKGEIEERLRLMLGVEKVLWLPRGLAADHDTDGHIDNVACFARPGVVLLAWTDDAHDEHYARCREAVAVLESATDARHRRIQVVKMPIPSPPMHYAPEDCEDLTALGGITRQPGERLAASYVNFYIANGGIVCPSFGCDADEQARAILQQTFPAHRVVQVSGREILLGGGNIHCITQQQPSLSSGGVS